MTKPTNQQPDARHDFQRQNLIDRIDDMQTASINYRARVQADCAAERAKPEASYAVGRAALDEAMRILGRGNFKNTAEDLATDVNQTGAPQ